VKKFSEKPFLKKYPPNTCSEYLFSKKRPNFRHALFILPKLEKEGVAGERKKTLEKKPFFV